MSRHTTRRRFVTALGLGGLALTGAGAASARGHGRPRNYRAHLAGENENPPVDTDATGQATFQLDRSGDELAYRLIVANIDDVFMAHIHLAPPDENGPVVAWLYPSDGPPPEQLPGRSDGVLVESTLTADDLTGPLDGDSIDDLVEHLENGTAYVNVHTAAHGAGEIRGQIH